ncbi:MAG: hypothetical protein WA211_02905 [Candidatus Acidiferrales bacterium]
MNRPKFLIRALLLAVVAHGVVHGQPSPRIGTRESVLERCEQADDVAVRFYYNPMINEPNLAPGPVIFLPVSTQDPRLGTRPGWSLYITLAELRGVLRVLAQSNLEWKESSSPMRLVVDPFDLPAGHHDSMQVAISCPSGSATSEVEAKKVCPLLSEVYSSLGNPKAREAFAHWTGSVNCVVIRPRHGSAKPAGATSRRATMASGASNANL